MVYAAKVATEFRQKFHKPVVIDMFCYRRFGHNEGDEPAFTQPLMYRKIAEHPTTFRIYADKLIGEGLVTEADDRGAQGALGAPRLEEAFEAGTTYRPTRPTGSTVSGPASRRRRPATRRAAASPGSRSRS